MSCVEGVERLKFMFTHRLRVRDDASLLDCTHCRCIGRVGNLLISFFFFLFF